MRQHSAALLHRQAGGGGAAEVEVSPRLEETCGGGRRENTERTGQNGREREREGEILHLESSLAVNNLVISCKESRWREQTLVYQGKANTSTACLLSAKAHSGPRLHHLICFC